MNDKAKAAILAHDPKATNIAYNGGNFWMAKIGLFAVAYYEIIDGKIVGDVWYE